MALCLDKKFAERFYEQQIHNTWLTCWSSLTATNLKSSAHSVQFLIGQRSRTQDKKSTNDKSHHTCDLEDAPEGSKNWQVKGDVITGLICNS